MPRTLRCPQCGLMQLSQETCKKCGTALAARPIPAVRRLRSLVSWLCRSNILKGSKKPHEITQDIEVLFRDTIRIEVHHVVSNVPYLV